LIFFVLEHCGVPESLGGTPLQFLKDFFTTGPCDIVLGYAGIPTNMEDACKLFSPACCLDASKILLRSCRDLQTACINLDAVLCRHPLLLGMQAVHAFTSKPLVIAYVLRNPCVQVINPALYTAMSTVSEMASKLKALFAEFLS
jgi:hypothetical protein